MPCRSLRLLIGYASSAAIALSAVSCNTQGSKTIAASHHADSSNLASKDGMPVPPPDAEYTISCQTFASADHMAIAQQARNLLCQTTPMKQWYVIHSSDHSTLYYGFYRTFDSKDPRDPDDAKHALADLNAIRSMQTSTGERPFGSCLPVPIDAPDPAANPAWDITKTHGYWSIEIATYSNTPDRKVLAVQSVAEARKQGIEAYYYHGPTASSVCIGAWPQEAADEIEVDKQNVNPDAPIVITPRPVSDQYAKALGNVQAAASRVEILDPSLTEALNTWKEHSVNGQTRVDTATGEVVEKPFLFKIPHDTDAPPGSGVADTGEPPVDNSGLLNPNAPQPGVGSLRSLGGN